MKYLTRSTMFATALAVTLASTGASASLVSVDARLNSVGGGTGMAVFELLEGQRFQLDSSVFDTWSAGTLRSSLIQLAPNTRANPISRPTTTQTTSDANGLVAERYSSNDDDVGLTRKTLIGRNFGLFDNGEFAAPYASLVGRIGEGQYFLVGTDYDGVADISGLLRLFFWDANAVDNSGQIAVTADIVGDSVPEPASAALVGTALGALAWFTRRRKA